MPALAAFLLLGTPVVAHPAQESRPVQDNDITSQELARFDQFLDSHREIAEQVRQNPSLVNNDQFVKNHPPLQNFLQEHPGVREELKENPNAFMQQEARYDRDYRDYDRDRDARADKDRDRDARSSDEDRDRDARVGDNDRDRDVRTSDNDRDRDARRDELANFDRFLDSHHEIAEQLRKDPSLADNGEFLKTHPALQNYLKQHPGVQTAIKQNPNAFMQQEARYDQYENRSRSAQGDEPHRHFGEFLGSHSSINDELSKKPSLAKNQEYLENHPELKDYLDQHPDVRQGLSQNPESFVKSSQQFSKSTSTSASTNGSSSGTSKTPGTESRSPAPTTTETKPK